MTESPEDFTTDNVRFNCTETWRHSASPGRFFGSLAPGAAVCPLCGFSRPKERVTCEPCDDAARAVATAWFASIWKAGA